MLTYQEEYFTPSLISELKPMFVVHWEELANNKDIRPLDVDLESYTQLNEAGAIRWIGVRDEGKLVGYASFVISNNLHYKNWACATCDVYYLSPEYRNQGNGVEFFEHIEDWLKEIGVQSIVVQDKINHSHESFFLKRGFNLVERTYEKLV